MHIDILLASKFYFTLDTECMLLHVCVWSMACVLATVTLPMYLNVD